MQEAVCSEGSQGFDKERSSREILEKLRISGYCREQDRRVWEVWGGVADWVRLRDIEIRVVVRARVVLLVSGSCW